MNSIIDFQKEAESRERLIWKCECGNHSFLIYEDGELECANCGKFHKNVTAHKQTIRKWTRKRDESS